MRTSEPASPAPPLHALDPPTPFVPDEGFRVAAKARGRHLRRRRVAAMSVTSVMAAVLLLLSGATGFTRWKTSQIVRVRIGDIAQIDATGAGAAAPAPEPGVRAPFNVLVIGTDDLPGPGRDAGGRSDTMMIVHVDMAADAIRVVSLPRDLWVTLADGTGQDRLNVAVQHGPETLIRTINQTFGVRIDHFAMVNGPNMVRLIDAIGGVPLQVERAMRDRNTGLDLSPGCRVLSGEDALALGRSRHLEVRRDDGRFVEDPTSDLGRERRQQVLGEAIVRQAGRHGTAIGGFGQLARLATDELVLDDQLGISDLTDLARWSQDLPPEAVRSTIPQVRDRVTPQGGAVLDLAPNAVADVRSFLADAPDGPPPGPVTTSPATSPTTERTNGTPAGPPPTSGAGAGPASGSDAQPIAVPAAGACG